MDINVGCCGFPVSKKKYFENFRVVEIQQTFYKILNESLLRKWREEAPKDFKFTIKAFQGITHDITSPTWRKSNIENYKELRGKVGFLRPTREVFKFWEKTLEEAKILKSKIIILQLPASFKDTEENIKNAYEFFNSIKISKIRVGIELRGWSTENIKKLCQEFNLIDITDPFRRWPIYLKDIAYFRLHGKYEGNRIIYKYKYTDNELQKLASCIKEINVNEAYVMFNNVYMFYDALKFRSMLNLPS